MTHKPIFSATFPDISVYIFICQLWTDFHSLKAIYISKWLLKKIGPWVDTSFIFSISNPVDAGLFLNLFSILPWFIWKKYYYVIGFVDFLWYHYNITNINTNNYICLSWKSFVMLTECSLAKTYNVKTMHRQYCCKASVFLD